MAHTLGIVASILNKGYAVDFFAVEQPPPFPDINDLKINRVIPKTCYVVPRDLNHHLCNQNILDTILSVGRGQYDFIYHRLSLSSIAGVMLSRMWKCPLVLEYNGSESWLAANCGRPLFFKTVVEKMEAVCLRHAHLIVTVSDVLRDQLISGGVEPQRIVSHANGVDPQKFGPRLFSRRKFNEIREHLGVASDAVVVTFVGTFGQWHGAEILAETLRRMVKTDSEWMIQSKMHVVFIGDGVRREVVEATVSATEVRPFRTITGLIAQDEAPLYMAASDILVSPHVRNSDGSPFFGSPTKLFEYLASGRPVIASDLYQLGDVLEHCPHVKSLPEPDSVPTEGQCGIRVTPEDEAELSEAIKFLVDNAEWRQGAGKMLGNWPYPSTPGTIM